MKNPCKEAAQTIKVIGIQLFSLRTMAVFLILFSHDGCAQSIDSLWQEGLRLEKGNKDVRALSCFNKILDHAPNHIGANCKASRLYCRIGGRTEIKSEKIFNLLTAKRLARKAILLENENPEAHWQYIVSLGMLSEIADNPREKLESAKTIKREADIVLSLDSGYAGVYYVLGKWNDVLSDLNWFERFIGQTLLGGLPSGASYADALKNFQRAIDLQPGCILFYYGMANSLAHHGQFQDALRKLEDAQRLPNLEPDDQIRKEHCKTLARQIKMKGL